MTHQRKWSRDHDHLKESMEKEVTLLREILANLFEEELLLANRNIQGYSHVHSHRTSLLKTLGALKKRRLQITKRLQNHSFSPASGKKVELSELLPPDHENTSHVLFLQSQKKTLLEKMYDQKVRNHYLSVLQKAPLPKVMHKRISIDTLEENQGRKIR